MALKLGHTITSLLFSAQQARRAATRRIMATVHRNLAIQRRRQSKARFIIVTGSSGKTTTVRLLEHILSGQHRVAAQSLNNSYFDAVALLRRLRGDEDFVILEAGTLGPGDVAKTAELFRPDISLVTLVALEHYSAFRNIQAVAQEKAAVVEALRDDGMAILNFDSPEVRSMAPLSKGRIVSFALESGDYTARQRQLSGDGRLRFTLKYKGTTLPIETSLLGVHNWLAATAAATCALELGISPQDIATRTATFEQLPGRLTKHELPDGTTFILDSVKAPYHSVALPLALLSRLNYQRKRVVIGQLSDYSGNPKAKYRDTYRAAREIADEVIMVGNNARKVTPTAEDAASGNSRQFDHVRDLARYLAETATPGEVVVVKSASNLHLERLLLMRQSHVSCWTDECRVKLTCQMCGLYGRPYAEHLGQQSKAKRETLRLLAGESGKASLTAAKPTSG